MHGKPPQFRPGEYSIRIESEDGGAVSSQAEQFYWGLLAMNFNKSVYFPGETAFIQMAALDDSGNTLCGADLSLVISDPFGATTSIPVDQSGLCGPNNIVDVPDYAARYAVPRLGIYSAELSMRNESGQVIHRITDSFDVRAVVPYEVERTGPTRIYPPSSYRIDFSIWFSKDFSGSVVEAVPKSFTILNHTFSRENSEAGTDGRKTLSADITAKAGEAITLSYEFDAPDVSPFLYLLGPLEFIPNEPTRIGTTTEFRSNGSYFAELRQWQIAADAVETEILKPTASSDPAGQWVNDAGAYDTGTAGDATTNANSSAIRTNDPSLTLTTWQTSAQTHTSRLLYIRREASGCTNDTWSIQYSTTSGTTWNTIESGLCNVTLGTTSPITIDNSVNLSNLQVKIAYQQSAGPDNPTIRIWDVWLTAQYNVGSNFEQTAYRWYANRDDIQPNDPWPSGGTDLDEDTAMSSSTSVKPGDVVRLRMSLQVSSQILAAESEQFKLQWAGGGDCSTIAASDWSDVGPADSSANWRGYDNSVADGATLSTALLSGTEVVASYEEENNSTSTPNEIGIGEDAEWDWVIQNNTATSGRPYCFRMVKSDGTALETCTTYPQLVTNDAPSTPTQHVPFDNEKLASTTPFFEFTSLDGNGNDIRYQIQIDDNYDFGSPLFDHNSSDQA